MKKVVYSTPRSVTELYRPDSQKEPVYKFHTTIHNDDIVDKLKRARIEQLVRRGNKIRMLDNAEIQYAFSCTPEEWAFFERDYPELCEGLRSKDDSERQKAARRISILHPEWLMMAGHR